MRAAFKILSLVVIYCIVVTGFKASISRVQLKSIQRLPIYVATNDDSRESRNIFREMVQAFVDAFPTMLQPQKEMDVEKVNTFEKTQKWVKVSICN
jgi:uridine kinase